MIDSETIKRQAYKARKKLYSLFYNRETLKKKNFNIPFDGRRPEDEDQDSPRQIRKRLLEAPSLIQYLPKKEQKEWIKAMKWSY